MGPADFASCKVRRWGTADDSDVPADRSAGTGSTPLFSATDDAELDPGAERFSRASDAGMESVEEFADAADPAGTQLEKGGRELPRSSPD
jgi:hypothetical protein